MASVPAPEDESRLMLPEGPLAPIALLPTEAAVLAVPFGCEMLSMLSVDRTRNKGAIRASEFSSVDESISEQLT